MRCKRFLSFGVKQLASTFIPTRGSRSECGNPHATVTRMPLEASIQRIDPDIAVITLRGPLTLGTNLKTLDSTIQTLIHSGARRLVFDLSASPYADSAGLGTLIHASGCVAQRGGVMRIAGVSDRVLSMLRMTRTDTLMPVDPDTAASLAALRA